MVVVVVLVLVLLPHDAQAFWQSASSRRLLEDGVSLHACVCLGCCVVRSVRWERSRHDNRE